MKWKCFAFPLNISREGKSTEREAIIATSHHETVFARSVGLCVSSVSEGGACVLLRRSARVISKASIVGGVNATKSAIVVAKCVIVAAKCDIVVAKSTIIITKSTIIIITKSTTITITKSTIIITKSIIIITKSTIIIITTKSTTIAKSTTFIITKCTPAATKATKATRLLLLLPVEGGFSHVDRLQLGQICLTAPLRAYSPSTHSCTPRTLAPTASATSAPDNLRHLPASSPPFTTNPLASAKLSLPKQSERSAGSSFISHFL